MSFHKIIIQNDKLKELQYMQEFTLDIERNKYIYLYYLLLHLVCLSWTNIGMVAPSSVLRMVVTFAVFIPLVKYIWMAPAVIILFVGLRFNSVAPFGYIPQSWEIYEYIIIVIALFHVLIYRENYPLFRFTKEQICLFIFLFIIDLINLQPFSPIFLYVLMLYLLYNSITDSKELHLALFAFVILTITLSIYYFLFAKEFMLSYYGSEADRAIWIDPNYFGILLGCGVVISSAYLFSAINVSLNMIYKIIFIVCIILGFMVIALQASRGAMLATVIALIIQLLFSSTSLYTKFFFTILAVVGVVYLFESNYFTLLIDRTMYGSGDSGRSDIWMSKIGEWLKDSYNIMGTGYRSSVIQYAPYNYDCHNEFVSILINYGIIGLFIALINIFILLIKYINNSFIWSIVLFISTAFMTLSPITEQTGWPACPFLLLLLYKFVQLKKNGEF